ncbi:MAG TPA: TonB-dependent receptor [Methylocella sp.]|nr:TonB-dependent receptor [Methylocella sp.]
MRLYCLLVFGATMLLSDQMAKAEDSSSGGRSSGGPSDTIELPEVEVEANSATPNAMQVLEEQMNAMDQSRDNFLLPKFGATSTSMDYEAIEILPQGLYTPIDKVLLQLPGVSYDSAVSNPDYHVRNEYANVQYRINGILLPEGVSGLGPVLETNFIGNLNLLDGALPAQYGLRTAGVVDLTTRSEFVPGGTLSLYGGSFGTISPRFDYGGSSGNTQYFFTGSFMQNNEGLENATPTVDPIHDRTEQGKFFGYLSTMLGDSTRLTYMTGTAISQFQIPNVIGQQPLGDFGGTWFNSTNLNENEYDSYVFNILALQTKGANYDMQLSFFNRYASVHFIPDIYGDLVFNDIASDVTRQSLLNGIQFDGAYRLNDAHTLRAGFAVSGEETQVNNTATVLPLGPDGTPLPSPFALTDYNSKIGWNLGGYIQDEWEIADNLTLNTGLRFDQLYQFVTANQFSPRVALVYKPFEGTSIHAGYARYFTPPMQAQATPTNLALFNNTTQQPVINVDDPVLPERSHYFDVGVDQKLLPGLTVGADAYLKLATDLLDDGQFGQAVVLTQFNYANGYSEGLEFKAKYQNDGFTAYANFSTNRTKAINVVSNQYLFTDPVEFAYIANNYHFIDDAQLITASAGASYKWDNTLVSLDGIFGSGLRAGFANLEHQQPYTQFNFAISRDFNVWSDAIWPSAKPLNLRFTVVNLLDTLYQLRSGTGIGEFAPQYGPRRGFYVTLSQKL